MRDLDASSTMSNTNMETFQKHWITNNGKKHWITNFAM